MLWDKDKYIIDLKGGRGRVLTKPHKGIIQHLMVIPESRSTIWSMKIVDADGDEIFEILDHKGRLDDKEGLPVGQDKQQRLQIMISDSTKNEKIKVIFKVREVV